MKTSYKKYGIGGVAQSFGSPMIESGMQTVTGNWGGSPVSVFAKGGYTKRISDNDLYRFREKTKHERIDTEGVGNFELPKDKDTRYLYELNDFDKNLVKDIKLKPNEHIFRYETYSTKIGGYIPLVKINLDNQMVYFLTENAWDGGDIEFVKKGEKAQFINISDKYANGGKMNDGGESEDKNQYDFSIRFFKDNLDVLNDDYEYEEFRGTKNNVIKKVNDSLTKGKMVYAYVRIENIVTDWYYESGDLERMRMEVNRYGENEYAQGGGVDDINMEFLKVFRQYGFINSDAYGHNVYENKNKDIIVFSPKSNTIGKGWLTLQLSNNMEERLHLKPFTTSALIDFFNKYGLLPTENKGELSYTKFAKGGEVDKALDKTEKYWYERIKNSNSNSVSSYNLSTNDIVILNRLSSMGLVVKQVIKGTQEATYTLKEKFAKGGKIENQYEGKTPSDIWNMLSLEQRQHFLYDHKDQIEAYRGEEYGELTSREIITAYRSDWAKLDNQIKNRFKNHVREGQYGGGGLTNQSLQGTITNDALPDILKQLPYNFTFELNNERVFSTFGGKNALKEAKMLLKTRYDVDSEIKDVGFKTNSFALIVPSQYVDEKYAQGGAVEDVIKGSNPSTGEKFGVVIGSLEKEDGRTTMIVRSMYSSRIKSYELRFDEKGFLSAIGDFGTSTDGTFPDMNKGRLSVSNVAADNKKESIDAISKITSPSFAKKVYDYVQKEKMAKGGQAKISIANTDIKFDKSLYKGILDDYDLDGLPNADDPNPYSKKDKVSLEQTKLSTAVNNVINVKNKMDDELDVFVKKLQQVAPSDSKIYGRTKTPFSILNKLVNSRLLDQKRGLKDLVGTTVAFGNYQDLQNFKKRVDKGMFGKVVDFDDYYENPNDGYRAYHYIVEQDGTPIELQLKTDRMKEINVLSHDAYKNQILNKDYLLYLTTIANDADKGNTHSMEQFSEIMSKKVAVKKKLSSGK